MTFIRQLAVLTGNGTGFSLRGFSKIIANKIKGLQTFLRKLSINAKASERARHTEIIPQNR